MMTNKNAPSVDKRQCCYKTMGVLFGNIGYRVRTLILVVKLNGKLPRKRGPYRFSG